jgi:hypothetical protein
MFIKAGKLKVGDSIKVLGGSEVISKIENYPGSVMVFFESQADNPFISSQYASYNLSTYVEVI